MERKLGSTTRRWGHDVDGEDQGTSIAMSWEGATKTPCDNTSGRVIPCLRQLSKI